MSSLLGYTCFARLKLSHSEPPKQIKPRARMLWSRRSAPASSGLSIGDAVQQYVQGKEFRRQPLCGMPG